MMWISSIKIKYILAIAFACLLFRAPLLYSGNAVRSSSVPEDTSFVELRSPDPLKQKQLLEDPDYLYDRVGPAPKSMWTRFWEWFWRKAGEILDTEGGAIGFRIVEYMLILGAIALMIYLLVKNDIRALFYGKGASIAIDFSEFEENIHQLDFNELIAQAVAAKDYRRAVRLHFLKVLKELSDQGLINWQINKTNNDYSVELADTRYSSGFKELARLYEYIWYGEFSPDEEYFNRTLIKFKSFQI